MANADRLLRETPQSPPYKAGGDSSGMGEGNGEPPETSREKDMQPEQKIRKRVTILPGSGIPTCNFII